VTLDVAPAARPLGRVPPSVLVLLAIVSTQIGGGIAKGLFAEFGPRGTVFIRVASAALLLLLVSRPRWRGLSGRQYGLVLLFGAILGAMNFAFYSALARIPLGVAVTVEFTGPLLVAVAGSRRARDLVWVALAAAGILLLSPIGSYARHDGDGVGIALALCAGACWGAYILTGARLGRAFAEGTGLSLAMAVAALGLAPAGAVSAATHGVRAPALLAAGCAVGLLSSALPYTLEVEALRRLPTRVFGVWMSLEPAVAAVAGFLMLGERLGLPAIIALVLITIASAGAAAFG
jgi:inner membrane transporter RhtA